MKRMIALLLSLMLVVSLAACSPAPKTTRNDADDNGSSGETVQETAADNTEAPVVADISSWTWVKGELDCYGYDEYYLSYEYPEQFKTSSEDSSGFQSRNYSFNPSDSEATANDSPYGIYITFGQGSFGGATKSSLEEDIQGGLTERELGGRTVFFGEFPVDENTGSHTFAYYYTMDDDEWSRIWIILCDPEADGAFRQAFEQSMNFSK